jgi:hypothetical protein
MIICVLKYFLKNVGDNETRAIMQQSLDLSNQHLLDATNLFNEEKLPIPDGFTDNDVNINAPRLFSDSFYSQYLGYMARVGMQGYVLILNQIARADIREFFTKRIYESVDLYNKSAELRLSQGTFIRAPQVEVPKEVQYIKKQSFLVDFFGEKRPLLAREITHIFANIFSNIIGRTISTGFGQVSKEKKYCDYFFEGKNLSTKQIGTLTSLLTDEGIPIPSSSWSNVTDSTISPFSDKLLLNHQVILCSSAISNLGMALADTMRSDLQLKYVGFTSDIMKYCKDGIDILIDRGELEQPPQAIKHENLAGV